MSTVPPRFAVVKFPPKFRMPPFVALRLPVLLHAVEPVPNVRVLELPEAWRVPALVTVDPVCPIVRYP